MWLADSGSVPDSFFTCASACEYSRTYYSLESYAISVFLDHLLDNHLETPYLN